MPLSLGISYFGLGMQRMKIKSQFLKVQANANSWDKVMADPHMVRNPSLPAKSPQFLFHEDAYSHRYTPRLWGNTQRSWYLFNIMKTAQASDKYLPGHCNTLHQMEGHCWTMSGRITELTAALLIQMTELNGSVGSLSQAERNCVWPPHHREHEWLIKITPWSNITI